MKKKTQSCDADERDMEPEDEEKYGERQAKSSG